MNAEALIGTVLGTCTLQALIGQGGMGAVFLAQQSRPRRQVAVKVLLPMMQLKPEQQVAFLERFRRETDAAASLDHPNILPVHEYGERDGLAYLVMPYISGGTLRDELEREKRLPWTKIVSYLEQLAAALDAAHARGVIHRDVKPANILITPEKRLLLSDFGLVKLMSEEPGANAPLTKVGMPVGTPDYMAPEQVIGRDVDARADIYSLGVILYQMVVGEVPFKGDLPMQVAMQHLHMPPPSPRALRPDLPLEAEQIIMRALSKRPDDRYQSAQEMASAFRLALFAAGIVLGDEMARGFTASVPVVGGGAQFMKPRGLFNPIWQSSVAPAQEQATAESSEQTVPRTATVVGAGRVVRPSRLVAPALAAPSMLPSESMLGESAPNNDIVAQTKMTLPSFTNLLMPGPLPTPTSSPATQADGLQVSQFAFPTAASSFAPRTAPAAPATKDNMSLPPSRGLLGRHGGLLRPAILVEPANEDVAVAQEAQDVTSFQQQSSSVGTLPATPQVPFPGENGRGNPFSPLPLNPMSPASAMTITTQTGGAPQQQGLPPQFGQRAQGQTVTGGMNTTTSLTMAGVNASPGQGMTTTLRLTQSAKIVKVPVAGQPGRYVTGLLRMPSSPLTSASPPSPTSLTQSNIIQHGKNYIDYLKNNLKLAAVVGLVVVLLFTSCVFLLTRSHTATPHLSAKPTPNLAATAAAQATAAATMNIILADPLNRNIHDWPVSTNSTGPQTYAFKDGAYHITDTNAQSSALALLPPEEKLPTSFVYTLTMEEIKGDDTTINNQFGMVFRLTTHNQNGKSWTTFYTFDVANTPGGEYQFWKYDDSYGSDVNPWTKLWSTPFGKEYHYGHGAAGRNTFSVVIQGSQYTFIVNGKKIGTTKDDSFQSGQIGMLVNWDGTEVAFSNLILTYH
jgi:serine/threonine protein kinase